MYYRITVWPQRRLRTALREEDSNDQNKTVVRGTLHSFNRRHGNRPGRYSAGGDRHLHWPQGQGKPALIVFNGDETKNRVPLEFEISTELADRLQIYRNEIVPAVTGKRPETVFVTWTGEPRTQGAVTLAIERTVLGQLGIKLTPHQFRHLAAKIILDANPGAYELVRQLLGHRNMTTTTNFYAGIDTRRAGRAHADLVMKLRKSGLARRRRFAFGDKPDIG